MPPLLPSAEILVKALRDRMINVIDLTAPLSDSTPVLPLPEGMEPIPHFALEELARYDERGETSYQNGIRTGEHVGTHFDAPCHWITGRDLADVASVPPEELISPFVVIDKSQEAADNPDFSSRSNTCRSGNNGTVRSRRAGGYSTAAVGIAVPQTNSSSSTPTNAVPIHPASRSNVPSGWPARP